MQQRLPKRWYPTASQPRRLGLDRFYHCSSYYCIAVSYPQLFFNIFITFMIIHSTSLSFVTKLRECGLLTLKRGLGAEVTDPVEVILQRIVA
jgi:hypothetical protein